jgi:hypothetical protein
LRRLFQTLSKKFRSNRNEVELLREIILKYLSMLVVSDTKALCNRTISTGQKSAAAGWVQTQLDELKQRFGEEK